MSIEQRIHVIRVEGEFAWVQIISDLACGHCQSGGGCGVSTLSRLFAGRYDQEFKVLNPINAQPGKNAIVSIPERDFLKGVFMLYLLPLFFMIGFAGFTQWLALKDSIVLLAGLSGLSIGLLLLRFHFKKADKANMPRLISDISQVHYS